MTLRRRTYLATAITLLAGLAGYVVMAFANLLAWDSRSTYPFPASLTGLPWSWPNAPRRSFLYNQPIWGIGAAVAYGLTWRRLRGKVRWLRVGLLLAAMSAAIGMLGLMVRDDLIAGDTAIAASLWLYGAVGLLCVRDWAARP